MDRLLVVWCPDLLEVREDGREARAFAAVVTAMETFAARVDPVRPGVCAVPTRGPSRYFGGDAVLTGLATTALGDPVAGIVGGRGAGVGIADGLFAATLAARAATGSDPVVVPPGRSAAFLDRWPVATLDRPELADLLVRLGVRTLGAFAALPTPLVLARFGGDGARCQRLARGVESELPGFRLFFPHRHPGPAGGAVVRQNSFWGDTADADARATRVVDEVQRLLGPDGAVRGTVQGGRGPAQRARLVPWTGPDREEEGTRGPWPGRIPSPAPAMVLDRPLPVLLTDIGARGVGVTGDGLATAPPARLSVAGEAWVDVAAWAGPWPSDERWWSGRGRRRQARMQVVTTAGTAYLLTRERGSWWLEATYD